MNLSQWTTLLEKEHYPFRNYPKNPCDTVLFPGCSFPAQFPKTMEVLSRLAEEHGMGVAYDCCGKPVAELEREKSAARIADEITRRLTRLGVKEIACLCPNCLEYLRETLHFPVVSVYALLQRWGYAFRGKPPAGVVFRPCPDRKSGALLAEIGTLCPLEGLRELNKIPCCGLRGDIAAHGPQGGDKLCAMVRDQSVGATIYTYCASCAGQFQRHGCGNIVHLLSVLLSVEEEPDAAHALWNRSRIKSSK